MAISRSDLSTVRSLTLDAQRIALSALVGEPTRHPPRGTIVALHGAGMTAAYFHGQAIPGLSLLDLGAQLGFLVIAIDRPGYGLSAPVLPEGQGVVEQAATLSSALREVVARFDIGAGLVLHAHSFGAAPALATAAHHYHPELLGLDISGCGHRRVTVADEPRGARMFSKRSWLPLDAYPPEIFQALRGVATVIPPRELRDLATWEADFPRFARNIRVPTRFTFAEHERWWRHDEETLDGLRAHLRHSPRVLIDRQVDAGHNISLGYTARPYHLRSLAFAEECFGRTG